MRYSQPRAERASRALGWLVAFGSLALFSCSGSSGGADSDNFPGSPDVDFAVLSTSVTPGAVWRLNRPIEVEFTHDIDFGTVSQSTVQIRDSQGLPAIGTFSLLDARTIQFQPTCPTNDTNSDGGLRQGRSYRLTIAALSNTGIGGGVTVRNTAGKA